MADAGIYKVIYTKRSLGNLREIKGYLLYHFTQKEVDRLYNILADFERIIIIFPTLYPLIENSKNVRRAVLSKQLSVFYTYSKNRVSIASVLDNRMNISRWPK